MADEHPSGLTVDAEQGIRDTLRRLHATRARIARRNILIVVIVLVVIVGGVFLWRYLGSYESTDDAQVDAHLYPVSARVSGYVTKVNVDDNQYVQKGAVLVEIDPKDYEVAVEAGQSQSRQRGSNRPVPEH